MMEFPLHPPSLGGNKKWEYQWKGFPFHEITPAMKRFYLIGLAYHLESWLHLVLNKPKNDFAEMFLHHLATAILIMGSYMTNSFCGGAVVMFVLDHADVWIGLIRVVIDAAGATVIALVAFGFGTMFGGVNQTRLSVEFSVFRDAEDARRWAFASEPEVERGTTGDR